MKTNIHQIIKTILWCHCKHCFAYELAWLEKNYLRLLSPANELCEGYVFTRVCPQGGGVPGQVPPRGSTPPGLVHPLGRYTPQGAVHAGRYGQQAGGTHPTGMHSCHSNQWTLIIRTGHRRFYVHSPSQITHHKVRYRSNETVSLGIQR